DLGVVVAHREPGEAADIGNGDRFRGVARRTRAVDETHITAIGMRVVCDVGFLPPEKKREVGAPIEGDGGCFGAAHYRRRTFPRERGTNAPEAAIDMAGLIEQAIAIR